MRLFFASWPPPEVARALARWAQAVQAECGGRATREDLIHLTLAFHGDADAQAARELARGARSGRTSFVVTEARYWARRRIVWVGPKECPAPLATLAHDLGETRQFAAHITLLRKARAPRGLPDLPALEWPVAEFLLVNSTLGPEGPSYEVIERYALV
jgi:2'-5' RNA ligase